MSKPKKLTGLLTLEEFKKMLTDSSIRRTREAANDC